MKEEVKYFLVLEYRPGDYNIIDINKLDICDNTYPNNLIGIDLFTLKFTEGEIRESITRSNIVQNKYLSGNLRILSNVGHNLECMYKDDFENVREFQLSDEVLDNNYRNKLFGKYKKILETFFTDKDFINMMLGRFKNSIKENNKLEIFEIIEELFSSNIPYNRVREMYFVVAEYMTNKKKTEARKLVNTGEQ